MCGITGIINHDKDIRISESVLNSMCAAMTHRGPDEGGVWTHHNVGIGMRRLKIIDLVSGSQPMHNEDKSIWIVFNGEIYNFQELKIDLEKRGHFFKTKSDTETIIHLYEEYGRECIHYLRGMFAFAIYDLNKDTLFLVRDRLGIKPLFYLDTGTSLLFGSEIKCLLEHPDVECSVHHPSIITFFAFGYVPDPDTMFEKVKKLPPGHMLTYRDGYSDIQQYWNIKFQHNEVYSEEYYIERILYHLDEAVRLRLLSDVPLGAFLSGGIDSSMVVAMMARNMGTRVKTFSIGFENQSYSELEYARAVSTLYDTEHHEEIVRPDAEAIIDDLIHQFDEPFADSSAIPTFYVSKMTRKHVTVSLSGDGGDELFAGYDRYFSGFIERMSIYVPLTWRKFFFLNLASCLPEFFPGINTLRHLACNPDQRYLRSISKGVTTIHKEVFSDDLKEMLTTSDPSSVMLKYLSEVQRLGMLSKMQYLDIKTYLPGDILTKVDRMSMLVSLEARVPFLDHKLVEFAATIPPAVLVKKNDSKYLLKKAAERLLPEKVIYRPKMGFAVPIAEWLRNEWEEISKDLILSDQSSVRRFFCPAFINRIFKEHKSRRRNHDYLIWTLMVLELWFKKYAD
ncbi:amidotransferase 1, exosortase A system-associated [Desulfosarcina widdelii]|uniref:asparagine synthase (glutamine-hydrolyzing) n=1 Tax=Desulfosarcina widdelii TaxID=947919 RepID=A0A5K7YXA8_9BACT|nr:asparagine synthase (glutamine-hydrolyzing) [Desulfosarcina widdelii]BBO72970.1 amidotransferase 1, exosortase A system-associated [Desulfosarcina widdelii]